MQPITIGTKASASVQVTEAQLAVTVGSGYLRVFATQMQAAQMEKHRMEEELKRKLLEIR